MARLAARGARGLVRNLIRIYQLSFSALAGRTCRFLPTCSDYADDAIANFGIWRGGWMAASRLARCQPFGDDGFDPVPRELPESASWYMPWRYGRWRAHKKTAQ